MDIFACSAKISKIRYINMYEIRMPEAGFSITEGTVIKWHKQVGEKVGAGETVVSVETEKITVDLPAEGAGYLREIKYRAGEVAQVGAVLGIVAEEVKVIPEAKAPITAAGERGIPETGAETGIAAGMAISKKASAASIPAVSAKAGKIYTEKAVLKPDRGAQPWMRRISPLAKALARKWGIDIDMIKAGTGPEGRIVRDDVLHFMERAMTIKTEIPAEAAERGEGAVSAGAVEQIEAEKPRPALSFQYGQKTAYSRWQKVIAERVAASARSAPHYTMSVDIDVTELAGLIARMKEKIEKPKITYLPFVMKALAAGIEIVPQVNAYCYDDGYVIHRDVHAGIAVDLGEKLLVPVVRGVRERSIIELAEDVQKLVEKARSEKLEPKDIEGATITITNVGVYNIHSGTSILFQPQSAIIYVGVVREEPAVHGGAIAIRKKMMLGGTFDHRLVHGGPGARFLNEVKHHLEDLNAFILNL